MYLNLNKFLPKPGKSAYFYPLIIKVYRKSINLSRKVKELYRKSLFISKFTFALFFFLTGLLFTSVQIYGEKNNFFVLGYYPTYFSKKYPFENINFSALTHIALAFADLDKNGLLITGENFLKKDWIRLAHERGVKVLLSVGGWGKGFNFPEVSSDPLKRGLFAHSMVLFCKQNNLDGIDIDWEFPKNIKEKKDFILLAKDIKTVMKKAGRPMILSAALGASPDFLKYYDIPKLYKYFDFLSIMTYDYHGPWSKLSGHNSPLFGKRITKKSVVKLIGRKENAEQEARRENIAKAELISQYKRKRIHETGFLDDLNQNLIIQEKAYKGLFQRLTNLLFPGMEKKKIATTKKETDPSGFANGKNIESTIVLYKRKGLRPRNTLLGIPFYGRSFHLRSYSPEKINQPYKKTYYVTYRKIRELLKQDNYSSGFDKIARVPYLVDERTNEVIFYDNAKSISEKVNYFKKLGFRGIIIWELTQDRLEDGSSPLLDAIEKIRSK